jgi:putative Holliday junction resolvase
MRTLGLDLGTKTLGIALSDTTNTIASPLITINYDGDKNQLLEKLKGIIDINSIKEIVLGFPKNMNNTIGERALEVMAFKKLIEDSLDLNVFLYDERLTTKEAETVLINADLSRKKRKKVIDKMAAVIILQNYLNRKKGN